MEFYKKTSRGITSIIIKILLGFILLFIITIFIDKIDFPAPNKKIEKIIPNDNFKIVK